MVPLHPASGIIIRPFLSCDMSRSEETRVCGHPDLTLTLSEPTLPPAGARAERRARSALSMPRRRTAPARGFSPSKAHVRRTGGAVSGVRYLVQAAGNGRRSRRPPLATVTAAAAGVNVKSGHTGWTANQIPFRGGRYLRYRPGSVYF